MKDLSFIIPIRVDTEDRIDNCLTVLRFLFIHFPESEVLLMEQDSLVRTQRLQETFPMIRHDFLLNPDRFNKSLAVNTGIALSTRPMVCMCDTDILLHPEAIRRAARMVRGNIKRVVIPYNRMVLNVSGDIKAEIVTSLDLEKYGRVRRFSDAPVRDDLALRENNGGIFVADKEVLVLEGGVNKKMISYGWEDSEFSRRLDKLGYYTFMLPEFNLVHLDHRRGPDSQINEMFDVNRKEFEKISAMSRRALRRYVETDLDIAPGDLRSRRAALRRRQDWINLITFQWLTHMANKVWVNFQINGLARFFRKFVLLPRQLR